MIKIKRLDNSIKTGLLYNCWLNNPVEYCLSCNADALHPHYSSILNENYLQNILKSNIQVNSYTVNNEKNMITLLDNNISSIITNYPDKLYFLVKENK